MTQENSEWHDRREVKIADYGEKLIQEYLEGENYICYKPVTEGAHLFDFLIYRKDSGVMAAEVKTKPRRNKYPDTGFDYRHYEGYKRFSEEHNMKMYVFFVDELEGKIYGNSLEELDKPRISSGKNYPLDSNSIRYYPLEAMRIHRLLTDEEKSQLRQLQKGAD
ncbi:MAG: hypothetical protein IJU48_06920 [Synergistaceae bacterium]|nr:hypothetical protein [Synergistaceae bacterium]